MHGSYHTRYKSSLGSTASYEAVHPESEISIPPKKRKSQAHCCWVDNGLHSVKEMMAW